MSTPEPESGYALDRDNCLWRTTQQGQWACDITLCDSWVELCEKEGPMTPLLPAERPEEASEHALPAIVWIDMMQNERTSPSEATRRMITPNGRAFGWTNEDRLLEHGLPVPKVAPAKSLVERMDDAMASIVCEDINTDHMYELLEDAIFELTEGAGH